MPDDPHPPTASHGRAGTPTNWAGYPGGLSFDDVAALVECASGADTAAIEALEAVAANLRHAAAARAQLAAHVPPEMLRQVLLARSTTQPATQQATQQAAAPTALSRDGLPS